MAENQEEWAVVDPSTGGMKNQKLARYDLIPPKFLKALAEHYGRGASKYEPRNWEKGYAFSLSFGALNRHAWAWWGGEDDDPEFNSSHLLAVAWHAIALFEFMETHPEKDDRPCHPQEKTDVEKTTNLIGGSERMASDDATSVLPSTGRRGRKKSDNS